MFIEKAYARRDKLSHAELERLFAALKDEAERYRDAIVNSPPERLELYEKPFLATLEQRVEEVQRLLSERANGS